MGYQGAQGMAVNPRVSPPTITSTSGYTCIDCQSFSLVSYLSHTPRSGRSKFPKIMKRQYEKKQSLYIPATINLSKLFPFMKDSIRMIIYKSNPPFILPCFQTLTSNYYFPVCALAPLFPWRLDSSSQAPLLINTCSVDYSQVQGHSLSSSHRLRAQS